MNKKDFITLATILAIGFVGNAVAMKVKPRQKKNSMLSLLKSIEVRFGSEKGPKKALEFIKKYKLDKSKLIEIKEFRNHYNYLQAKVQNPNLIRPKDEILQPKEKTQVKLKEIPPGKPRKNRTLFFLQTRERYFGAGRGPKEVLGLIKKYNLKNIEPTERKSIETYCKQLQKGVADRASRLKLP